MPTVLPVVGRRGPRLGVFEGALRSALRDTVGVIAPFAVGIITPLGIFTFAVHYPICTRAGDGADNGGKKAGGGGSDANFSLSLQRDDNVFLTLALYIHTYR